MPLRRRTLILASSLTLAIARSPLAQTAFPTRPIRILVPFTPGGSNDVLGRVLAEKMAPALGQPVVVENKPGASGNIGADAIAKSAPDGYNLLIAANNVLCVNPLLYSKMPFDSIKDFAPISLLGIVPIILAVNSQSTIMNVKDLIDAAKTKPGGLSYASSGSGSPQHLSAELFKSMTGTNLLHVPYKGAGPAVADLLAGLVDMQFGAINTLLPHIRSGRLRAIGICGLTRLPSLPDVPPIADTVPGFESDSWLSLVAPAGTPAAVIDRLNAETRRILALADVTDKLAEQGIEPRTSSPAQLKSMITADLGRWTKVVREAGIKAE